MKIHMVINAVLFQKVRDFFLAPKFLDDEKKTSTAELLNFILFVRFFNTFFFSLSLAVFDQKSWIILIPNGILITVLIITRFLMHRGLVYPAVIIHLLSTFIGANLTVYALGVGTTTPTFVLILTLVVLQSGLLVNLRYMIVFGMISALSMTAMAVLEINGFLPTPLFSASPADILVPTILLFFEITSMVWLALKNLQKAMSRAQQEVRDRRAAEAEVRALNEELEKRVRDRTIQLEIANQELESFAYSVSHDLRAPLRAIDGFTHILLEDHSETLSEEAIRYQNLVRKNTRKMALLIDDLLNFSRMGRKSLNRSLVSPETIVKRVLDDLKPMRDNRKIVLDIGDLPDFYADPGLMYHVYLNLLENAVKYTRPIEVGRIKIGSTNIGDETVYFVGDNGVGFDMKYVEKMFGVFQRLHTDDEFEGTGIGLAITESILHRHGGRIWVEAEVDTGATFYFTVP